MFIEMYVEYAQIARNLWRVLLMYRATEIELAASPSRPCWAMLNLSFPGNFRHELREPILYPIPFGGEKCAQMRALSRTDSTISS